MLIGPLAPLHYMLDTMNCMPIIAYIGNGSPQLIHAMPKNLQWIGYRKLISQADKKTQKTWLIACIVQKIHDQKVETFFKMICQRDNSINADIFRRTCLRRKTELLKYTSLPTCNKPSLLTVSASYAAKNVAHLENMQLAYFTQNSLSTGSQ